MRIARSKANFWAAALLVLLCLIVRVPLLADEADSPDAGPRHFKGREIAQTMHFLGASWLTRDSREREEDCTTMLGQLGIKPGDVVCDMGCGNGFYTLKLAKLVGDEGKVLAVDIQQEMLHLLSEEAKDAGVENIQPILGGLTNPRLPDGKLDLILLVDVYHEFSHPEEMLRAMRKSLKPTGRLALVEFRLEDPNVPIKLLHKMSKDQVLKEIPPCGYRLSGQFDKLPWQHLMFFERDDAPGRPKQPQGSSQVDVK